MKKLFTTYYLLLTISAINTFAQPDSDDPFIIRSAKTRAYHESSASDLNWKYIFDFSDFKGYLNGGRFPNHFPWCSRYGYFWSRQTLVIPAPSLKDGYLFDEFDLTPNTSIEYGRPDTLFGWVGDNKESFGIRDASINVDPFPIMHQYSGGDAVITYSVGPEPPPVKKSDFFKYFKLFTLAAIICFILYSLIRLYLFLKPIAYWLDEMRKEQESESNQ